MNARIDIKVVDICHACADLRHAKRRLHIIDGVIPNGAVRSRKSDTTGKVTCSPAFIRNFTDDTESRFEG